MIHATTFFFGGPAAVCVGMALVALWHLRWMRKLPPLEPIGDAEGLTACSSKGIRCSVIVAARDEERRIEQAIRRLLAQKGVEAEVIAVDDRSSDGTPAILESLAKED